MELSASALDAPARIPGPDGPVVATSFDESFERLALSGRKCVVVALSGGSDSTALLYLFKRFAEYRYPSLKIVAVTVDHGLRAGSAEESLRAGAIAHRLGVAHVVKRWDGEKPASGVMQAAREARHRLLAEAADEAGTDLVLVAHTLDDQAETVAMRGARGQGRGQSGMAVATLHDWRVWFARALLGAARQDLRAVLTQAGIEWIDDPSNENMRFERVRVRAAQNDAGRAAIAAEALEAGEWRIRLGERAASLIERFATMPAPGLVRLDPSMLTDIDREAAIYALRILLSTAGGSEHLPDAERAAALIAEMARGSCRATLAGAVADSRKGGIYLHRENRNLPTAGPCRAGLWDRRFRLQGEASAALTVAPAGDALDVVSQGDVPTSLLRAAAAGLPGLWSGTDFLGPVDGRHGVRCDPAVAPWARYLPAFDLAPARVVARLTGSQEPSAPPLSRQTAAET